VRDRTNETHATSLDEFLADITAEIAERRDPVAEAAMDGAKQAKAE
jgi:hypothetical protein